MRQHGLGPTGVSDCGLRSQICRRGAFLRDMVGGDCDRGADCVQGWLGSRVPAWRGGWAVCGAQKIGIGQRRLRFHGRDNQAFGGDKAALKREDGRADALMRGQNGQRQTASDAQIAAADPRAERRQPPGDSDDRGKHIAPGNGSGHAGIGGKIESWLLAAFGPDRRAGGGFGRGRDRGFAPFGLFAHFTLITIATASVWRRTAAAR